MIKIFIMLFILTSCGTYQPPGAGLTDAAKYAMFHHQPEYKND